MNDPAINVDRRRFAAVRRTAVYRALLEHFDRPVILACSGGTDSAAMLATAAVAYAGDRIPAFLVAHVDHQARDGSAKEGRFVAALARAFGCPFVQLQLARPTNHPAGGIEAMLRSRRYAALARLAGSVGVDVVATAHTKDDQIETILLRLLSGAGAIASAGMRSTQMLETEAGRIVVSRPLLNISRVELSKILEILELPHVEDPSNLDLSFRRNRIRHRIIPELEALDPGFADGLIRAVGHARDDADVLDRLADEWYEREMSFCDGRRVMLRKSLVSLDSALATRVVRRAVLELVDSDHREVTMERIAAVLAAAGGRTGAVIELPYGIVARIEGDSIIIAGEEGTWAHGEER